MAALSTFNDGDRLDRIGPGDYSLNPAGRFVKAGTVAELYVEPNTNISASRTHIPESALSPASAGNPTPAEIASYVAANNISGTMAYYTGTDSPNDPAIDVFFVDESSYVLNIESDSNVSRYVHSFVGGNWVLNGSERDLSIPASVHGLGTGIKSVTLMNTSGDVITAAINIHAATGNVTATVPDGNQFSGTALIM